MVSTTELSLQGNTCFDRLFVGTQHLLHLSPEHSADSDPDSAANRIDAAAKWWERVEGRLRGYASRTRNLVARALNLDATLGARFRGECESFFFWLHPHSLQKMLSRNKAEVGRGGVAGGGVTLWGGGACSACKRRSGHACPWLTYMRP